MEQKIKEILSQQISETGNFPLNVHAKCQSLLEIISDISMDPTMKQIFLKELESSLNFTKDVNNQDTCQSFYHKFRVTTQNKANVGQMYVNIAKSIFYLTSFILKEYNECVLEQKDEKSFIKIKTDLANILQQYINNTANKAPQLALKYFSQSYYFIAEPNSNNFEYYQVIRYSFYNQLKTNSQILQNANYTQTVTGQNKYQEIHNNLNYEYINSQLLFNFEKIYVKFQQQFSQQRALYQRQKSNQQNVANNFSNNQIKTIITPFGEYQDEYNKAEEYDISGPEYSSIMDLIQQLIIQSRHQTCDEYKEKILLDKIYLKQYSSVNYFNMIKDKNATLIYQLALQVEQICQFFIIYKEYHLLSWEDSQTNRFILKNLHHQVQQTVLSQINILVNSVLDKLGQISYQPDELKESMETIIDLFLRKSYDTRNDEKIKQQLFKIIARQQLIQSINKLLLSSYETVEYHHVIDTQNNTLLNVIVEKTLQSLIFDKLNIVDILQFSQTVMKFDNKQAFNDIIETSEVNYLNADKLLQENAFNNKQIADQASSHIYDVAQCLINNIKQNTTPQPLYVDLIQNNQPQLIISVLSEIINASIYTDVTNDIDCKFSEDYSYFKLSYISDSVGFLKFALNFLINFFTRVVDASVAELLVTKTVFVLDYSSYQFLNPQTQQIAQPAQTSTFGNFNNNNTTAITQQPQQLSCKQFSTPVYNLLIELFCTLTIEHEILNSLCIILQRIKLTNQQQFFDQLLNYKQIFDKFLIILITNKTLAGSLLQLFKNFDQYIFYTNEPFSNNIRQMLVYDLINISHLTDEHFYLEKLYDFLHSALLNQKSIEPLYQLVSSQQQQMNVEQLNIISLKVFYANVCQQTDTNVIQSQLSYQQNFLKYITLYQQLEQNKSQLFSEFYNDITFNNNQQLNILLHTIHVDLLPLIFNLLLILNEKSIDNQVKSISNTNITQTKTGSDKQVNIDQLLQLMCVTYNIMNVKQVNQTIYYDIYQQCIQIIHKLKNLLKQDISGNLQLLNYQYMDELINQGCISHMTLNYDSILFLSQLLETKYYYYLISQQEEILQFSQQTQSLFSNILTQQCQLLHQLCVQNNNQINNIPSFQLFTSIMFLLLLTQILQESENIQDISYFVIQQLQFVTEIQVQNNYQSVQLNQSSNVYNLSQQQQMFQKQNNQLKYVQLLQQKYKLFKEKIQSGKKFKQVITMEQILQSIQQIQQQFVLNDTNQYLSQLYQLNIKITEILKSHVMNQDQEITKQFFNSNLQLLGEMCQLLKQLNNQQYDAFDIRNVVSQKIIVILYINLKYLSENQYFNVSIQQVKSTVDLESQIMDYYQNCDNVGEYVKSCVHNMRRLWGNK